MAGSEQAALVNSFQQFNDSNQNWFDQTLGPSHGWLEVQITAESKLVPGIWLGTESQANAFDYWYINIRSDAPNDADDRDHDGGIDDTLNGTKNADVISTGDGHDFVSAGSGNDQIFTGSGNDEIFGDDGDDIINGGSGDDQIYGGAGNDDLQGGSGQNTIDGGTGIDVVRIADQGQRKITKTASGYTLENASGDRDILINVERLDLGMGQSIALDVDATGNAGQAMGLIGVVAPGLLHDLDVRSQIISLFDQGQTMKQLCQRVLDLPELAKFSDTTLAKIVFQNVTGNTASEDMHNTLVNYIEAHGQTDFLAAVAQMHINIDLVGLQQSGLAYSNFY